MNRKRMDALRHTTDLMCRDLAPFITHMAMKFYRSCSDLLEMQDLTQAGYIGLIRAVQSFRSCSVKMTLLVWCKYQIVYAMKDEVRLWAKKRTYTLGGVRRISKGGQRCESSDFVPGNDMDRLPSDYPNPLLTCERISEIENVFSGIPPSKARVLKLLFLSDLSCVETAKIMGVSSSRISQIVSEVARLKKGRMLPRRIISLQTSRPRGLKSLRRIMEQQYATVDYVLPI